MPILTFPTTIPVDFNITDDFNITVGFFFKTFFRERLENVFPHDLRSVWTFPASRLDALKTVGDLERSHFVLVSPLVPCPNVKVFSNKFFSARGQGL